ncbi:MAG: hypothetical protein ACREN4_05560 [Candidatus Dormibacteria bacterium]
MTEPRRLRRSLPSRPEGPPRATSELPSEWLVRLAWALLGVACLALLGDVLAIVATLGAIVHLGALRGPLEFALVLLGALLGLVGSALTATGCLAVLRPDWTFAGRPGQVLWGLGLQVPAAAAAGVLEASPGSTVAYLILLAGLAWLWWRFSPPPPPVPLARHPAPDQPAEAAPAPTPAPAREPFPWLSPAPPPPSAPGAGPNPAQGRRS